MCTVSVIPWGAAGIRVVFNRDEQRHRPRAMPPAERIEGGRQALYPVDPAGGGTWIGANDVGLVLALLNVNPPVPPAGPLRAAAGRRSRGAIIPPLLRLPSVDAVLQEAMRIEAANYAPFRLLIGSRFGFIGLVADGAGPRPCDAVLPARAAMFTSSGLGDAVVDPPRRQLFDDMLGEGRHSADRQDAYHRHRWPSRDHLSVCMARPDARTVSRTVIELSAQAIEMRYADLDESGQECAVAAHALAVRPGIEGSPFVEGALP
jgi:hypothetical protein